MLVVIVYKEAHNSYELYGTGVYATEQELFSLEEIRHWLFYCSIMEQRLFNKAVLGEIAKSLSLEKHARACFKGGNIVSHKCMSTQ